MVRIQSRNDTKQDVHALEVSQRQDQVAEEYAELSDEELSSPPPSLPPPPPRKKFVFPQLGGAKAMWEALNSHRRDRLVDQDTQTEPIEEAIQPTTDPIDEPISLQRQQLSVHGTQTTPSMRLQISLCSFFATSSTRSHLDLFF